MSTDGAARQFDMATQTGYEGPMTTWAEAEQLVLTRLRDGTISTALLAYNEPRANRVTQDSLDNPEWCKELDTVHFALNIVKAQKRKAAAEYMCAEAAYNITAAISNPFLCDHGPLDSRRGIKRTEYERWTAAEAALNCLRAMWQKDRPDAAVADAMQTFADASNPARHKLDGITDAIYDAATNIGASIEDSTAAVTAAIDSIPAPDDAERPRVKRRLCDSGDDD